MSGSIFEDVKLEWDGKEYTIPSNRVMGLIERIEDHLSFSDLLSKNPKIGKIAGAWAEALRYAGAAVSDEQVYAEMFRGATTGQIKTAVFGLMEIMVPPQHIQKKTDNGAQKKPSGPEVKTETKAS